MLNPHGGLFPHGENCFHMLENCFHMLRTLTLATHHCFGCCPHVHLNIEGI